MSPGVDPVRGHGSRDGLSYAGMALLLAAPTPCSGAALQLNQPALADAILTVDGIEVEVRRKFRTLIVRGGVEDSYEASLGTALIAAQTALDLMSMRGLNDLVVSDVDDEHVVWWIDDASVVLRLVSVAPSDLRFNIGSVVVTDSDGRVVPPLPPPPIIWHPSYRYFRLSQTTSDLFDAYRNAHLALESILSSMALPQPGEREIDWFRRALTTARENGAHLASVVPSNTDAVDHLTSLLYTTTRTGLSHAKNGRPVLQPLGSQTDREAVQAGLGTAVDLYLLLSEHHLGAARPRRSITRAGFRLAHAQLLDSMVVVVSDDESAFDPSEASPNPNGGTTASLTPVGAITEGPAMTLTRQWSASVSQLSGLRSIRRIAGTVDDHACLVDVLDGPLQVGTPAVRVEVQLGFRAVNSGLPRRRYPF
jgi:hypothetical protein